MARFRSRGRRRRGRSRGRRSTRRAGSGVVSRGGLRL